MKKLIAAMFLATVIITEVMSAPGDHSVKPITWDDLLPPSFTSIQAEANAMGERFDSLSETQQEQHFIVQDEIFLHEDLARGSLSKNELTDRQRLLIDDPPSQRYPQARDFWADAEDLRNRAQAESAKPNEAIIGQTVQLQGYLLPLEFDNDKVKEFLLVPYVGACIHVPPPPGNQIVYVSLDVPYRSEGLFSPVLVEGAIDADIGTHQLHLVDGTNGVETSYSIKFATVSSYKAKTR